MIDILKHISIVVLQDVENEVKMETEQSEDIDIKHEQDVTLELVRVVKIERKVKASVLLCLLIYKVLYLKPNGARHFASVRLGVPQPAFLLHKLRA